MARVLAALGHRHRSATMATAAAPENVQGYPRPPLLHPPRRLCRLRVELDSVVIAETTNGWRVCETHHPENFYIPQEDVNMALLRRAAGGGSFCEWKGVAQYWDVVLPSGRTVARRCWSYLTPTPAFEPIAGHLAFYADPFECFVDGERAAPQPGGFYGGWVTSRTAGTVKGSPGTAGW